MPISNTPLTKAQFEYLQQNITDVYNTIKSAGAIAQSGLQYVVNLQVAAPEVDLIIPFAQQLTRVDGLDSASNFTGIVAALNLHVITRGATTNGTLSERLNGDYLDNNGDPILVTAQYASISGQAGFVIDPYYIDPTVVITLSTMPAGTVSVSYSQTVTTSGGTSPKYFQEMGIVPTGLALNQSSGVLSGTPTTAGTYNFTITVTDAIGSMASKNYVVVIS